MVLLDKFADYQIFLVSKSPRRHDLLTGMGFSFQYLETAVEEFYPKHLMPVQVAEYLSQLKLSGIERSAYPDKTLFIACDTIVVLHETIIGKPQDKDEALAFLHRLSGHTHQVISGLTVATPHHINTEHSITRVRFASLTEDQIQYYVNQYLPLDKAGAYGVQEWLGYTGIEAIEGSFYNVMGLPTQLLWQMLEKV
ncbi:MAG: Maf family protein [Bacteroidales bacterium]|jgi:septum formation protein|nr:Maf family protein [Bacteroidales bacterium]